MKYLFYRPLKVREQPKDVFFWSDTHFNHKCDHWPLPLWKARGFSSIEEHNEGLIEAWNSKCNSESIFFHLGDFIFGIDSIDHFKKILHRVNFKTLYVMPGNHNSGWKQVFEEQKNNVWKINENKRVIFIPNYLEAYINNKLVVMSHYPIISFNGQSKGSYCLYGHVHGNLQNNEIGKLYSQALTAEVCVETCSTPISFIELKEKFENKSIVTFDSHC